MKYFYCLLLIFTASACGNKSLVAERWSNSPSYSPTAMNASSNFKANPDEHQAAEASLKPVPLSYGLENPVPLKVNDLSENNASNLTSQEDLLNLTSGSFQMTCEWILDDVAFTCAIVSSSTGNKVQDDQTISWKLLNGQGEPLAETGYRITYFNDEEPWHIQVTIFPELLDWLLQVEIPNPFKPIDPTILSVKKDKIIAKESSSPHHAFVSVKVTLNLHIGDETFSPEDNGECAHQLQEHPVKLGMATYLLEVKPYSFLKALHFTEICGVSSSGHSLTLLDDQNQIIIPEIELTDGEISFDSLHLAPGLYRLKIYSDSADNYFIKGFISSQVGQIAIAKE